MNFFNLCFHCQRLIVYIDDVYNDLLGNIYCSLDCLWAEKGEE